MEAKSKQNVIRNDEEIIIDFGEICRFCLADTNSKISIQDSVLLDESMDSNSNTIFNFVQKFTSIKMNNIEHFPSFVCENCFEVVKACYEFSQVCQQSDNSLRDCYEQTLKEAKAKLKTDLENDSLNLGADECFNTVIKSERDLLSEKKSKTPLNIQADCIKLKYEKMNSLSERLKEAQTKLAEDILRSNDMMLELPKGEELVKLLKNQKSPYGCPDCSLEFGSPEALKFHYVATHGQTRKCKNVVKFQCKKCVKNFNGRDKLLHHYEDVHEISSTELTDEDLNLKVRKTVWLGKRKFYCLHCVPYKLFWTRSELVEHLKEKHEMCSSAQGVYSCEHCENETTSKFSMYHHLRVAHQLKEDEITWRDFKYKSNQTEQKLFKVFLCTDCSPPVSFANLETFMQHKTESHEKLVENISQKELSAVYVNSQPQDVGFKVLCKNCTPPSEFSSANDFINHMCSNHDTALENWDVESLPEVEAIKNEPDDVWKCLECSLSFDERKHFVVHMKEEHNKTNVAAMKCPEPSCSESFPTNRQLVHHGITAHQKYFANFHSIYTKNFLQTNNDEEDNRVKNFECDICKRKYVCKNSLKRHIVKNHVGAAEKETVVCSYCGKTLSSKLNLKSHIEFVHEAVFVNCPLCRKNINFKTIGKHYKTHQTNFELVDSKNRFLCNLCGKILKSKRSFQEHQNLHKNIRDQLCDICGSGFTSKKFLLLHKKTHEGQLEKRMFGCDQCDKVFSGRHTLNRHLLTHSGEKNFICEICSKCFYTLQELNRHVRYHKKEYRFDCQLCDMRFLDKSRFRHHMMKHRNVRPHKCQFCDKMFIVRGKMNMHMAAKHNVEIQSSKPVWKDPKTYVPLDDLL